jgi:hypothetical protein
MARPTCHLVTGTQSSCHTCICNRLAMNSCSASKVFSNSAFSRLSLLRSRPNSCSCGITTRLVGLKALYSPDYQQLPHTATDMCDICDNSSFMDWCKPAAYAYSYIALTYLCLQLVDLRGTVTVSWSPGRTYWWPSEQSRYQAGGGSNRGKLCHSLCIPVPPQAAVRGQSSPV